MIVSCTFQQCGFQLSITGNHWETDPVGNSINELFLNIVPLSLYCSHSYFCDQCELHLYTGIAQLFSTFVSLLLKIVCSFLHLINCSCLPVHLGPVDICSTPGVVSLLGMLLGSTNTRLYSAQSLSKCTQVYSYNIIFRQIWFKYIGIWKFNYL